MKLAHMRPLLQTQEGLGERAKVFWTFISSQRLSLFPIHTVAYRKPVLLSDGRHARGYCAQAHCLEQEREVSPDQWLSEEANGNTRRWHNCSRVFSVLFLSSFQKLRANERHISSWEQVRAGAEQAMMLLNYKTWWSHNYSQWPGRARRHKALLSQHKWFLRS